MSEIPEVFAIFEQKLAHVLSFNLRQKGQKKAIEELLVYFSGIVGRASKAEARIAELEEELKAGDEGYAYWLVDSSNEIRQLKSRIAELEAESERFTVHSDIERQDDKSPNDTQSSTIVYGKESEE